MADNFAAQGYLTVVPDLFNVDPLNPELFYSGKVDFPAWLARHDTTTVDPIADVVIDHLKSTLEVKKLAGVGYCFGGKVSTHIPSILHFALKCKMAEINFCPVVRCPQPQRRSS